MSLLIKWLLVAVVAGLGYHWWRSHRVAPKQQERPIPAKAPRAARIREMATCRHCGLHADREDMVQGTQGVYCTDEHRRAQVDERI